MSALWPAMHWKLSAPESYVLSELDRAKGSEALKLAVKELVVRGILRTDLEPASRLTLRGKPQAMLVRGPRAADPPAEPLAAVLKLVRGTRPMSVKELAREAARAFSLVGGLLDFRGRSARTPTPSIAGRRAPGRVLARR